MMPNIAVIIPAYNAENFIENAIISVLEQPYKNINILIIDDGSTDSTGIICDKLVETNNRVRVIHQKNSGVSSARNRAIEEIISSDINSDYIIFLDADDFWFDNAITLDLVASFDNMDIIGMSTYISDLPGKHFRVDNLYNEKTLVKDERGIVDWLFGGHFGAHMIKTSLFRKYTLRFMEKVRYNEDVIFIREAFLCAKSIKFFSVPIYGYRMNDNSAVHKSKINLENATDIAFGWYNARCFSVDELSESVKKEWYNSCEMLTGVRLLESAMELAKNGYNSKQINETIFYKPFSYCYNELTEENLCDWQKRPYRLLNKSVRQFVVFYRIDGIIMSLLQKVSKMKIMTKYTQSNRYPLTKDNILS